MAKWYIKRNDKQAGPFESAQLKQLAADGKIKPDDLVRREDQTSWSKASDVKGLIVANSTQLKAATNPKTSPQPAHGADKHGSPPISEAEQSFTAKGWGILPGFLIICAFCFAAIYLGFKVFGNGAKNSLSPPAKQADGSSSTVEAPTQKQETFSLAKGCVDLDVFLEEMERMESFELTTSKEGMQIEGPAYLPLKSLAPVNSRMHIGRTTGTFNEDKLSAIIVFTESNKVAIVVAESAFDTDLPDDSENNLRTFFGFVSAMLPEAAARSLFSDNALKILGGGVVTANHGEATISLAYDKKAKIARATVTANCIDNDKSIPSELSKDEHSSDNSGDQSSKPAEPSSVQNDAKPFPKAVLYLPCDSVPSNVRFRKKGGSYSEGRKGIGVRFSGNDVSEIEANLPLGNDQRTLALWIKSNKTYSDGGCHVINFGTFENAKSFGILAFEGKWRFFDQNGGLATGIDIDDKWHHHAITYNGINVIYYFDGKAVANVAKHFNTSNSPLRIGGLGDRKTNLVGTVDEIYVFDLALSEPQIQKLFNLVNPMTKASNEKLNNTPNNAAKPNSRAKNDARLDSKLLPSDATMVFSRKEIELIRADRRLLAVFDMGLLTPSKLASYTKLKARMEGELRDENSSTIANMYMLLLIPANKWPDASRRIGLSRQEYIAVTKWTLLSAGVNEADYESKLQEMTGSTSQQYSLSAR
jgi:hypothetical protein